MNEVDRLSALPGPDLLSEIQGMGIELRADGIKLYARPEKKMTRALRQVVGSRKVELRQLVQCRQAGGSLFMPQRATGSRQTEAEF